MVDRKMMGMAVFKRGDEMWKTLLMMLGFLVALYACAEPGTFAPTLVPTKIPATPTPAPTPASTFDIGSVKIIEKDGMKLFYVPAGEFTMGSENGEDNEKPVHVASLDAFWIDQTEVTNGMYALCVNNRKCDVPSSKESLTRPNYYGEAKYNNYPVIFVDWNRAKTYCEWLVADCQRKLNGKKRLVVQKRLFIPWGNAMPDKNLLNYNNVIGDTTEVGMYLNGASPYGALDMAGSVWEWVTDWFASGYYKNSPASNPLGPESGSTHVLRGGSWNLNDDLVRSTYRGTHPSEPNLGIGFRCAMDAKQ